MKDLRCSGSETMLRVPGPFKGSLKDPLKDPLKAKLSQRDPNQQKHGGLILVLFYTNKLQKYHKIKVDELPPAVHQQTKVKREANKIQKELSTNDNK